MTRKVGRDMKGWTEDNSLPLRGLSRLFNVEHRHLMVMKEFHYWVASS